MASYRSQDEATLLCQVCKALKELAPADLATPPRLVVT